jgi:hypothetical protein
MKNKTGSTFVEAAMIFPLVILLVAGIISVSLSMYVDVVEDSQMHKDAALSDQNLAGFDIGILMRGKWILQ